MENIPRLQMDSFAIGFNKRVFNLAIQCGQSQAGFCLLPEGAKNLARALLQEVAKYEQQFGEIDMTGIEFGIQSPLEEL